MSEQRPPGSRREAPPGRPPPYGRAGGEAAIHPGGGRGDDRDHRISPGDPGTPPHRHPGPAFGYMLEVEMRFELEGEPERVIRAGDAFWEPGGDVIHYQDGNNRTDIRSRFLVTMLCVPGKPMLTLVDEDELAQRKDHRAPRPT